MAAGQFHHFGVPVSAAQPDETYIEGGKVYITDPEAHPYQIEYLRFDVDSPMHPDIQNNSHAAFMVESIEEALKGKQVITEPFEATETLRVAFINDGGAIIELMEQK